MKKILFITWDGPQTSYMEGLFMPIFQEVQQQSEYRFHVVQFTWGTPERIAIIEQAAKALGIQYTARPILRKPVAGLGSLYSLYKGIGFLKQYIRKNKIDIVMPRSTMPSIMVNRLKKDTFKVLFDADGLAIEERVDFSGLSTASRSYRFFKNEEKKMLQAADGVITRSHKAIAIHQKTVHHQQPEKFSVVLNGRHTAFFKPDAVARKKRRQELQIPQEATVFVYCGSLGPQYGWAIMTAIFTRYLDNHPDARFLILTGNTEFVHVHLPERLKTSASIMKVPFEAVPQYLNVADVAFAIREPKFSMQGVAPIKLGEYLLMGIPTIASAGIGDSEDLLAAVPNCFLFRHDDPNALEEACRFTTQLSEVNPQKIREYGIQYFSIEKSAESYLKALHKLS